MMHLSEIKELSEELEIAPLNIIREQLEIEILDNFSRSELSERVIFYGGTAIRLAYGGQRFSEDLDFIFERTIKQSDVNELESIIRNVSKKNEGVLLEEVHDKRNTLFGLVHVSHPLLKHSIRVKIELSKKAHKQESEYLMLSSPTSILNPVIKTSSVKSLIQNKLLAIKMRNEPRDWFDLWFLSTKDNSVNKPSEKFPFNKREFANELKRWLPKKFWKIVPNVISYYEKN